MKIAYIEAEKEVIEPQSKIPVATSNSATDQSGYAGWSALEMSKDPQIDGGNVPVFKDIKKDDNFSKKDIIDMLVYLGDDLDEQNEEVLANFTDFLIKKIAHESLSNEQLFNNTILKINNSDIENRNDTIKLLTKIYSKTLVLEYSRTNDLNESKELAYKKMVHRADQYLSE